MKIIHKYLSEADPVRLSVGMLRLSKRAADKEDDLDTPFNKWLKQRRMHWAAHHDKDVMKREKRKFYKLKLKSFFKKEKNE